MEWETYTSWAHPQVRHLFTCRSTLPFAEIGQEFRPTLQQAGFPAENVVEAEQTHGHLVGVVQSLPPQTHSLVDALITNLKNVPLVIRVADCGPIYFHDPVRQAIGLAHSGKKGTELNILAQTVQAMSLAYGSKPGDLRVLLGPCIRPPHYEVDFAAEIGRQARAAGIVNYYDTGLCTASNLDRYYSYRLERGHTGRMWSVLMLNAC